MWNRLRDYFAFGWHRLGDLSLISWLFPSAWTAAVSAAIAVTTAFAGWAQHLPPPHWIVLGLLSGILALLLIGRAGPWAIDRVRGASHITAIDVDASEPKSVSEIAGAAAESHRYMTVYEIIHYLADETEWGARTRNAITPHSTFPHGMRTNPLVVAPYEFKARGELGGVHAVGRLKGSGPHVEIPETYWLSATIKSALQTPNVSETVPALPNPDGIPVYTDVRILSADVRRIWPAAK